MKFKLFYNSPISFEDSKEFLGWAYALKKYIDEHLEELLNQNLEKTFLDKMKEDFQKLQNKTSKWRLY